MIGDTLTSLLTSWAADAPADIVVNERQGRRRSLTIGELVAGTEARAAGLHELGAGAERAVVAWLPNRVEYVELIAAAARAGAPLLGLNTRYRADELGHVLRRSAAAVLVTLDRFGDVDVAEIVAAADLPADVTVVVVPDGDRPDPAWASAHGIVRSWPELRRQDLAPPAPPVGADLAIGFTTSGTTGLPKLAVHDHAGTVRHAGAAATAFDLRQGDRLLLDLPLCGAFGYTAFLAAVSGRAPTSLHERFVPEDSADAFVDDGVTHYFGGDDMILRILDTGRLHAASSLAWRAGGFASFVNAGPLVGARVESELGVRLSGLYGMSEVFALLARWPDSMPMTERSRAGGIPVDPATEVRVVDPDTGALLPVGADGELCFRGPQVLQRYLGDPEATAKVLGDDGWFRAGDLGRLTTDGGFEFLARLGDSLRLRGFLVDPAEIERRLERHPAVELAQVVGADDPRPGRGQVAVAFVKLRAGTGATEDELRAHCAAGIADLKVPTRIVTVDEFPTVDGPNGRKIRKTDLRARAAELIADPAQQGPSQGSRASTSRTWRPDT